MRRHHTPSMIADEVDLLVQMDDEREADEREARAREEARRCPRCKGTGGGEWNDCPSCDGNGII
jgi:DnaJ-class molecular chaperone